MLREADKKFFKPLWRRVAITSFCAAWAAWEWYNGEQFWGTLALALAAYCAWTFLIKFNQDEETD